jgi:hypothetical protein
MIASVSKLSPPISVAGSGAVAAARPVVDEVTQSVLASAAAPSFSSATSVVVNISAAGAERSRPTGVAGIEPGVAPDEAAAKAEKADQRGAADSAAASRSTRQGIAAKLYKDADANKDGMVSVLESGAYNFINPSLPSPERLDELAGNRTAVAELQAYASVASAG